MNINDLYNQAINGDQSSEDLLFQRLSENFRLFLQHRIWNDQDAEEIVQETMMTIAKKYKDITFEKSFAAWAHKVLENNTLYYFRKKKTHESRFVQSFDNEQVESLRNLEPGLKKQLIFCLKKISGANTRHARILVLIYQGFNMSEICEKLSVTKNAAYITLSRARSMLRVCLEKGDIS